MTKEKIKTLLDYLPLFILIVSAFILVRTVISEQTGFLWKHVVGLILLTINFVLFFWRHKIGVLALGLTLLLGLVGLLSYSYAISITTFYFGKSEDFQIPLFYGQPIFILWLIIHFIVSGRHYTAIATKKYWQDLLTNSKDPATTNHYS
ncbi:MAG: hypothetical protein ACTHMD_03195 [Flavisolibacter sp.]